MDDKQKTIAVVVLAVVVVGVGAFQFLGSGSSAPTKKAKGSKNTVSDVKASVGKSAVKDTLLVKNPLFSNPLPARDPFQAGKITGILPPPDAASKAGDPRRIRVPGQATTIPPIDPTNLRGPIAMPGGPLTTGLATPKPDVFSMSLAAVIMGDRPAAVFQDEQGNQRLVTLGGNIDGDSVVTGISRGRVKVSHKGKTVTLTVGAEKTNGNP